MKHRFQRLIATLYTILLTVLSLSADTQHPTLRGRVADLKGTGLAGIRVSISTATPKSGPAYLCPSCYIDCGKAAYTDADGNFQIPNLDPRLTFELLAAGDGFIAQFLPKIDPAEGAVTIPLSPLNMEQVTPDHIVTGSVVDTEGEPIENAIVTVIGNATEKTERFGSLRGLMETPLAVSDERGQFILVANQPLESVHLRVKARNYANQEFYNVPPAKADQSFRLPRGASVTGRLLLEGKGLANKKIEIASVQRGTRSNFTRSSTKTNEKGEFTFFNLPPKLVYYVTASSESIEELGMTPLRRVGPLRDQEDERIEDLSIREGLSISGRVETSDGSPIPSDSVLMLSHDKVWNLRSVPLPPDGSFHLTGLHAGEIRVTVKVPGYRIAARNRSFSSLNRGELLATLTQSRSDLAFLMEPGQWDDWPLRRPNFTGKEVVTRRPLRGIEALERSDQAASVIVQAYDSETKQRLENIQITPGWLFEGGDNPIWHLYQKQNWDSQRPFTVAKRSGRAHLLVDAEGYIPESIEVDGAFDSEIQCYLTKGSGFGGRILTPEGDAAIGAQVLQTKTWPNNDRPYLVFIQNGSFREDSFRDHEHETADIEGRFQFPASERSFPIIITHPTGYLAIKDPQPQDGPVELRLQAWSTIQGQITSTKERELNLGIHSLAPLPKPAPQPSFFQNVLRKLGFDSPKKQPSFWNFVQVKPSLKRDDSGSFTMTHVPPGRWSVNLVRLEPYGSEPGSMIGRHVRKTPVSVGPGQAKSVTFPAN